VPRLRHPPGRAACACRPGRPQRPPGPSLTLAGASGDSKGAQAF
jgi:hypothetical protein